MFTIVDLQTMTELATFSCYYKACCRVAKMEEQGFISEYLLIWPFPSTDPLAELSDEEYAEATCPV